MYLRDLFFMLLLVTVVFTGLSIFITDFFKRGGKNVQIPELEYLNVVSNRTKELEKTFKGGSFSITFIDLPFAILNGIYQIFKLIIDTMSGLYLTFRNTVSAYLNLPAWFVDVISVSVSIFVLFEIISAVMKYRL